MGVTHHLETKGSISSVTKSYWVKNLRLSFCVSIKSTHEFEWYRDSFADILCRQYIDFQKQLVESALKLLGKSLKTVLDEVPFIVNPYSFPYTWSPRQTLSFPK